MIIDALKLILFVASLFVSEKNLHYLRRKVSFFVLFYGKKFTISYVIFSTVYGILLLSLILFCMHRMFTYLKISYIFIISDLIRNTYDNTCNSNHHTYFIWLHCICSLLQTLFPVFHYFLFDTICCYINCWKQDTLEVIDDDNFDVFVGKSRQFFLKNS